jgi:hypothetical protein
MNKLTTEERHLIKKLTERAFSDVPAASETGQLMQANMAITLCHMGPCRLRLRELSETDIFNLCHDVFGILKHYDVMDDTLIDCFVPRFAAAV